MNDKNIICELFEDIEIPERLSPENIAVMLKRAQQAEKKNGLIETNKRTKENIAVSKPTKNRSKILFRKFSAAAAACVVMLAGLAVYFRGDNGQIPVDPANSSGFETELKTADDYTALYNTFRKVYVSADDSVSAGIPDDSTASDDSSTDGLTSDGSFSSVEIQPNYYSALTAAAQQQEQTTGGIETAQDVKGVFEADIVKTDGQNLYYIADSSLFIVATDNGEMKIIGKISTQSVAPVEIFLSGDRLSVVSVKTKADEKPKTSDTFAQEDIAATDHSTNSVDFSSYFPKYDTVVSTYDISDKTNPTLFSTYEQNGSYISSGMIDSYIYIVTGYSNGYYAVIDGEKDYQSYVPYYSINGEPSYISPADISIPDSVTNTNYTIISGLDVSSSSPLVSTKAILGYDGKIYLTKENAYIAGKCKQDENEYTNVAKFSISNGNVAHSAYTRVDGYILSGYSMDEYNGNFRIATASTDAETKAVTNSIYVYDSDMTKAGELTGFANGRTLKSVRFDGLVGYALTSDSPEPVLAIDFSDPLKPILMNDTEAESYSTYLINYEKGTLLSFTADTDEAGLRNGFKLIMYTADGTLGISEVARQTFDSELRFATSYAEWDSKAVFTDSQKNLIGVPFSYFDGVDNCNRYYLLSYDAASQSFVNLGMIETHDTESNCFLRGVCINDVLYILAEGRIVSTNISDMSVIATLDLRGGEDSFLPSHEDETISEPDYSQDSEFGTDDSSEADPSTDSTAD